MGKNTHEIIVSVEGKRILDIDNYEILEDGTCKVILTVESNEIVKIAAESVLIEASKLKLNEGILNYSTKTFAEKYFKDNLEKAIKSGISDFYCLKFAPSIGNDGNICFESGKKPAIGKNFDWWIHSAKEFMPDKNSRIGSRNEYTAFLAVFMGKLVESGYTIEEAWSAICNNSEKLGNFFSKSSTLENTGSREICGICDLGNTYKIVLTDTFNSSYCWIAGGNCNTSAFIKPLSNFDFCKIDDKPFDDSVGWIIFDAT